MEETAAFLKALLNAHGNDFLAKLFGPRARDQLKQMGGVDQVAVALSREFLAGTHPSPRSPPRSPAQLGRLSNAVALCERVGSAPTRLQLHTSRVRAETGKLTSNCGRKWGGERARHLAARLQ